MNPTTNTPLIPSSTFRCHFKNRDELLEKLCERIYGGSPHYADDENEYTYGINPHLQGDDNPGPLACTYTAEEMLTRIHDGLENCKKMPPPQTTNDHLYWLGVRRTYETLYRQFTKEKA